MPPDNHPAVDEATLGINNCDREPVHIPGRIQSFGALMSVTEDWMINHASGNLCRMLGLPAKNVIGCPIRDVLTEQTIDAIQSRLRLVASDDMVDRLFAIQTARDGPVCDIAMHRSGRNLVLEFEHSANGEEVDLGGYVRPMIARMSQCTTMAQLCQMAARQVKMLTGMDRVMVYQFSPNGSGKVIAEVKEPGMEAYLGLAYPASDIPQQVRKLFIRNPLRVIADVGDTGVEIAPTLNPEGAPLDLSLSSTRAVSPIHLEYLRNMGVGASMSISIVVRGELWGLIACHHRTPRVHSYAVRSAAELFGLLFSYTLDQLQSDIERQDMIRSQMLHDQIMVQLAGDTSVANNFATIVSTIQDVIPHDGAVGWIDGTYQSTGETPGKEAFLELMPFLNTTAAGKVYATQCLSDHFSDALAYVNKAAGMLVLPVSRAPRDFIVLFRREIAKSVVWAGKPVKNLVQGKFGPRLTPRKSFEAWQETVRNHCAEWTPAQIRSAEALRVTLMEVVLRMADANLQERAKAQEKQELLIAELNHRVRNILNLIKGVVSQSGAGHNDVSSFTKVIGGRIHALAMAHDQITREKWQPASLRALIETEAAAYLNDRMDRLTITGPDVMLVPNAHTTMALVVHEMMTNSVKYGALAAEHGKVAINLAQTSDDGLALTWVETGGPAVSAPERRGFGTTIIERSIPFELKGEADLRFTLTGVEASFVLPANTVDSFVTDEDDVVAPASPEQTTLSAPPDRVLIVEDNIIIGLDAETLLQRIGVEETIIVPGVAEALEALTQADFDFVVLDINLGAETSFPVADKLLEKEVPFVFASGYGKVPDMAEKYADIPILTKPYDEAELRKAIATDSN
ncbi:HWE histidine kinase domain-containing protein [Yoonia sp. R2-816]